jgi:benzoyl-CoA reductase/2-hydroxyglutaryl-CoA dehydratase subunit BcrC/BadD/HgdB
MTTVCDQMRRGAELVGRTSDVPVFLMHVPTSAETPTAYRLYRHELMRLGRFLIHLGGRTPSDAVLADTLDRYGQRRSALLEARGRLSPRRFAELLMTFNRDGPDGVEIPGPLEAETPSRDRKKPVALVGGPLMQHDLELFDVIEKTGGTVTLDATTSGERGLPASFDRRRLGDDPIGELVDAYFGHIPDAFRRPNSGLYRWLKQELAARDVRGIVFRRYLWCDTWHAEAQRMDEWTGLPMLAIDVDGESQVDGRAASRIQAFLETIQ